MKKRNKLHMAMAMTAAIGGSSIGLLFAPTAGAVNLSQQKIGDALIFPYYTVRAGWTTLVSLINTSADVLAVKVRFRESRNSREVLDFTVLLSAYDRFSGTVSYDATDGAKFTPAGWSPNGASSSTDTTCIVAGNGDGVGIWDLASAIVAEPATASIPFSRNSYIETNLDGGPTDWDRLREGYVEVIVMGHAAPTSPIGLEVTHTPLSNPPGCAEAYNRFRKANILATARQFGEPTNSLKGSYSLLNAGRGVQAQGIPVALANFVAVDTTDSAPARAACTGMFLPPGGVRNFAWNPAVTATDCPNLIAAQEQFDFNEPSLADAYPSTVFELSDLNPADIYSYQMLPNFGPATLNDRGYGFGFVAVTEVLRATGLVNQWASGVNPLGSVTEWVVTQPTKDFYVDARRTINSAVSPQRFPTQANDGANDINTNYTAEMALPPFASTFAAPGQSCTDVGVVLFDNDEGSTSTDPDRSPGKPYGLCYEANVVHFSPTAGEVTSVLGSKTTVDLSSEVTNAINNNKLRPTWSGWMRLDLAMSESAQPASVAATSTLLGDGMPAIGFAITQRTFGSQLELNYAGLVDHSYQGRGVVTYVPATATPNGAAAAVFP